ncbi:MAG TPA: nicotinate-nucleotide adenylyltransferase [Dehalococcoidia bacterium]|jgi:nicotinate-nucleotide adenylyltransferase|nr:nicotinate-nucleotide adenylyltransferase [Dehalococcoidia bacterium]
MNIGVLGGTFDPVHNGHLVVAEVVKDKLSLAEVIFVPAGQPWLKADRPITPAEHRLQMLRLALADKPDFKISTMEIERPGPSYTVDTLTELRRQLGDEDELFFILGRDNLAQLPQWHDAPRLIELCYLVAVPRPSSKRPDMKALEAAIPGVSQRVMLLDEPYIDVSASDIRERVARGLSVRHLVPEPVNRYLKEHRLYFAETTGGLYPRIKGA